MSQDKMQTARELIKEKRYAEARAILKTVDHPRAKEWLAKIDEIDPFGEIDSIPIKTQKPKPRKLPRILLIIFIGGCGTLFLLSSLFAPSPEQRSATQTVQAAAQLATNEVQQVTSDAEATIIALTPPTATATITDTLIPSETPIPSATPPPSATQVPQQGTRGNPYPIGQPGSIRDGRFRVNGIRRNMTAEVSRMNMFNTTPSPGEEWVLVNVTFSCGLSPDETCVTTVMQLELVGDSGQVYDKELFAVIDNEFSGEVFGNGQLTGDVAFLVLTSDTNLLMAVNDLGDRIFFATQ